MNRISFGVSYIFLFFPLLLASCGKENEEYAEAIRFGTEVQTRSLITTESALEGSSEGIGIFGEAGGAELFSNSRLYHENDGWKISDTRYWIDGSVHRFAAVYPYSKSGTGSGAVTYNYSDGSFTIDCSTNALTKDSPDLLVGTATRDLSSSGNPGDYSAVNLSMKHLFACLDFKVYNSSANSVSVSNARLTGLRNKGTASVNSSGDVTWSYSGLASSEEYYFAGMSSEVASAATGDITGEMLVLPQQVNGSNPISFSFQTSDNESYSIALNTDQRVSSWESGKKYTYTMTLTPDYIIFTLVEVRDWRDGGKYEIN